MIVAFFLVVCFAWAVVASVDAADQAARAARAEDFAQECLDELGAVRRG